MHFVLRFLDATLTQDEFDDPRMHDRKSALLRRNWEQRQPVFCGCQRGPSGEEPKLSVVLTAGTFFLRRFAGTHNEHHPACAFAEAPKASTGGGVTRPGVKRLEDGGVHVSLGPDFFPSRREERANAAEATDKKLDEATQPRSVVYPRRTSLTPLGLVMFLFEEAGLSEWRPWFAGKRNLAQTSWRLKNAASTCVFGRKKESLATAVVFTASLVTEDVLKAAIASSPGGTNKTKEVLLVGRLASAALSSSGKSIALRLDLVQTTIFVSTDIWAGTCESHPREISLDANGDSRVNTWLIVTVREIPKRVGAGTFFVASQCSAVLLHREKIPVASSYEDVMCEYLIEAGRLFRKPLRYERSESTMFPDFVLEDTEVPTHIEVLGLMDDDYLKRIAEKRAECDRQGIEMIEWNAAGKAALPVLPAKKKTAVRPL